MQDFTKRFSGRALAYSKYRPSYPKKGLLEILRKETSFDANAVVADIGSGTGILAKIFLENGNKRVFGVEPNDDMRAVAEETLLSYLSSQTFVSINGTAEDTTLKNQSIDLITVGQAMHWFDPQRAPKEFKRIVAPDGYLCVIYNDRKVGNDPKFKIMRDYEEVANKYSSNRPKVQRIENDALSLFFPGWSYKKFSLENTQELDFEGLVGRLASASYVPKEGEQFATMKEELGRVYDENQRGGIVTLYYETEIFLGPL
jgi:SAM-dependent methyltransferase